MFTKFEQKKEAKDAAAKTKKEGDVEEGADAGGEGDAKKEEEEKEAPPRPARGAKRKAQDNISGTKKKAAKKGGKKSKKCECCWYLNMKREAFNIFDVSFTAYFACTG